MNFSTPLCIDLNPSTRTCAVRGTIASFRFPFYGTDLTFLPTAVFVHSKTSLVQFIQLFSKLAATSTTGCFLELALVGLGFRVIKLGSFLLLKLGYSHYIRFLIPSALHVVGYKKRLIVFGALPVDVNHFVRQLVCSRQPDVYKNKGVQLVGSVFRLKAGKQK
jgi:hypothetical protein